MQAVFIQHSIIEPEKSTVIFDARMDTFAYAFSSPGGTMTLPDCELPVGFAGVNLAAIKASCSPLDALLSVYPAACEFAVVNCKLPDWPSPAQVPPVMFTASAVPVPEM